MTLPYDRQASARAPGKRLQAATANVMIGQMSPKRAPSERKPPRSRASKRASKTTTKTRPPRTTGGRIDDALAQVTGAKEAMVVERRALVAGLLDSGASTAQITRAIAEKYDYLTPASAKDVARKYVGEARKARAGEYREAKGTIKAEQIARVKNDLIRMRTMARPPWSAIAKHEDLLARMCGTLEPIGVNLSGSVAVHESLMACVARLEPGDVERLVAEELALEAAALGAGHKPEALPAFTPMDDRSSMDTVGEPVPEDEPPTLN